MSETIEFSAPLVALAFELASVWAAIIARSGPCQDPDARLLSKVALWISIPLAIALACCNAAILLFITGARA